MDEKRSLKEIVKEFTTIMTTLGQRQVMQYMNRTGLSHSQMMTIGRLYAHGGVGISEMSAHMGTTDAAASQLIDRLVNRIRRTQRIHLRPAQKRGDTHRKGQGDHRKHG